ncbi:MAG TPA: hypothetical protein VHZ74_00945 [Bryobacteraceae bacterium]|nr:hypothetical protein [Bryobacteraceae bacterium]
MAVPRERENRNRVDFMKTFEHEWILEAFAEHPTFFTRRMFGGLAAYLFEHQMLLLVEPTKSGRWNWHGVLVCTDYAHHASLQADLPALLPHEVLRKWLFIDSAHEDFESTMEAVAKRIAVNDPRFGILPRSPRTRARKHIEAGRASRPTV